MNVSKRLGVAIPGYGLYLSSKLLLSDRLRVKAELAQGLPESARAFALCYNLDKFDVLLQLIVCTCIANSTLGLGIPLAVGLKPVVDTLAVSCGITSAIFGVYGEYVSNRKLWKSDLPSTG